MMKSPIVINPQLKLGVAWYALPAEPHKAPTSNETFRR